MVGNHSQKKHNPGSPEAVVSGCKCPRMDNGHGRGYMGIAGEFVVSSDCPIHWREMCEEALKTVSEVQK